MTDETEKEKGIGRVNLFFGLGDVEDCIVGDTEGLRRLIHACEEAIQEGSFEDGQLGEFGGVERKPSEWFEGDGSEEPSLLSNLACGTVVFCIFGLIILGLRQVLDWIYP